MGKSGTLRLKRQEHKTENPHLSHGVCTTSVQVFLKLSATYPDRQEIVKFRAHLHLFSANSSFLLRAADPVARGMLD